MPTLGERLREVREALGMSQQELADKCGVTMRSQRNYEKNERNPDSVYLTAIAAIGADVLYILTGQHLGLSPSDRRLLNNFHAAPKQVQVGVNTTLSTFTPAVGTAKRKTAA